MRFPSAEELQAQCDRFNAECPVGSMVILKKDAGNAFVTTTRSAAQVLSGHSAVIWLEGVSGCYLLDRVVPIDAAELGLSNEEGAAQ